MPDASTSTSTERTCELWRPGDFRTPDDPSRWFRRAAPLWIEIGFGNGDFLCDAAADAPHANLLGIETSPTCHRKALGTARDMELSNLQLVLAPAECVLRDLVPRASVEHVWINFPSPWPKASHADRRLLDSEFWRILADRLAGEQATVQMTTDRSDYLEFAREQGRQADCIELEPHDTPEAVTRTKYARQAIEEGRNIETICARRTGRVPTIEPRNRRIEGQPNHPTDRTPGETMHHAVLSGELPSDEKLSPFDKRVRQGEDRTAILLDCYRQVGDHGLLFSGQTNEPDLEQQVLVEVVDRSERPDKRGDLMVRMRPFNRPLATDGTRMVVDMVVDYLTETLQTATVLDRKY